MGKLWATALAALVALSLTGCGYNTLQSNDEQIKSSWSEVAPHSQKPLEGLLQLTRAHETKA